MSTEKWYTNSLTPIRLTLAFTIMLLSASCAQAALVGFDFFGPRLYKDDLRGWWVGSNEGLTVNTSHKAAMNHLGDASAFRLSEDTQASWIVAQSLTEETIEYEYASLFDDLPEASVGWTFNIYDTSQPIRKADDVPPLGPGSSPVYSLRMNQPAGYRGDWTIPLAFSLPKGDYWASVEWDLSRDSHTARSYMTNFRYEEGLPTAHTPEPSTLLAMGIGLLVILGIRRHDYV